MQNNRISDIAPVINMTELTELYINNNDITSLEPIMSLTTIEWLKAGGNPLESLRPVTTLTGLKKLYIEDYYIDESELTYIQDQLPNCTIVT